MPHTLKIELGGARTLVLEFQILATPIAELWMERMASRGSYALDHPNRFYGFDSPESELARAETDIQNCINVINSHQAIISRPFTHARDQDFLNYLHNIFEQYHGLLDQQNHEFWITSPPAVKQALAELNLAVHRCESLRSRRPRMVCTWFGMPKIKSLSPDLMQYGQLSPRFGSVCLNYAEIGKTLEDLAHDNDQYIGDEAFRPFNHYSADFVVRFFSDTPPEVQQRLERMRAYYLQHQDFFLQHGYDNFDDPRLQPLRFPVAQLVETQPRDMLYSSIAQHQHVNQVWIE
jgi:hypothetical protein